MSGRIDRVVLDKTGTLTYGRPTVVSYDGDRQYLAHALSGEMSSEHPVGRAIVEYCTAEGVQPLDISDFEYTVGKGISFRTASGTVSIGSSGAGVSDGMTHVSVTVDDEVVGEFVLTDGLRPEAEKRSMIHVGHRGMTFFVMRIPRRK